MCYEKKTDKDPEPPTDTKHKKKHVEEVPPGPMVVSRDDARKILLAMRYELELDTGDDELTLEDLV